MQHKVQCGLLLDVVVRKRPDSLKLLAGEDQPLLGRRNFLHDMDLVLDIVDSVRRIDVQGDGLACDRLDEDLHVSAEVQYKVECVLLLDAVGRQRPVILKLLARVEQPLLVRRSSFLVLDLGLDTVNGVRCPAVQGDGLACGRLDKDLHGKDLFELGGTEGW